MMFMITKQASVAMIAFALAIPMMMLAGCGEKEARKDNQSTAMSDANREKPTTANKENAVQVRLTTTMGDIVIELNDDKAPISTENFLAYVDAGDYDGTIFHRVMSGFMIQTGAFEPDMNQRPGRATIKNEWKNGLSNTKYTVAMARLGNQPDSASSQFFINVADNLFLDQPRDGAGYAVFGEVVEGQDVVHEIEQVATTTRAGHGDVPVEPVIITKAERVE